MIDRWLVSDGATTSRYASINLELSTLDLGHPSNAAVGGCLEGKALKRAEDWFAKRRARLEQGFDRLGAYLGKKRDLNS